MKPLAEIIKIDFKLFIREFAAMFFTLVFPVMLLLIFGGMFGNKPSKHFNGHGYVDISTPAYIAMIIAVTALMCLPLAVCDYREKKVLKRFMATPMPPSYILISQIIINFVMTIVGMIFLVLAGKIIFNLHFFGKIFPLALAFTLSTLSFFSLGFIIASLAPGLKSATVIANIVYFPMIFLSGAVFPTEMMPKMMLKISRFIPLTYVVDLLKGVWMGGNLLNYKLELIILIVIFIISIIVSVFTFRW